MWNFGGSLSDRKSSIGVNRWRWSKMANKTRVGGEVKKKG